MAEAGWIEPDWPAPTGVGALSTTRPGGVSRGPWAGLNLGDHVGDDPRAVAENRRRLRAALPAEPVWLEQVHGTRVLRLPRRGARPAADGAWTDRPGVVCAVLTADCLPLLLAAADGACVAAVHAGWRGLAAGVIESALQALPVPPQRLLAWIGPGIGAAHYEVGAEVRAAFAGLGAAAAACFRAGRGDRWLADLPGLARLHLARAGVAAVYGGGHCTCADSQRFYSYRRDGRTGRMASLIWIRPGA